MQEPQTREPLRDRFPDYMAAFSVMAALAMVTGLVVALFSSISYSAGAGYGLMLLGVGMLAVGGTQGGIRQPRRRCRRHALRESPPR